MDVNELSRWICCLGYVVFLRRFVQETFSFFPSWPLGALQTLTIYLEKFWIICFHNSLNQRTIIILSHFARVLSELYNLVFLGEENIRHVFAGENIVQCLSTAVNIFQMTDSIAYYQCFTLPILFLTLHYSMFCYMLMMCFVRYNSRILSCLYFYSMKTWYLFAGTFSFWCTCLWESCELCYSFDI